MIGLIIACSIIFLLVFLLCCSVSVEASFQDELSAKVRFLFLHYTVWPQPEEKEEQPAKQEIQKEEKPTQESMFSKGKKLFKQKGFKGFMELLKAFCRVASSSAKKILSHIRISHLRLYLVVGGEDAAQTAIHYGQTCALVSTALTALLSRKQCKDRKVQISPDFQNGNSSVQFQIKFKIRLVFLLIAILSALFGLIKIYCDIIIGSYIWLGLRTGHFGGAVL